MKGLPGCGKSTKRKEMMADPSLQPITFVNKDSIRKSLGIVPGNFDREKEVKAKETKAVTDALAAGINLIVDNTHNSFLKYLKHYTALTNQYGYTLVVIDLTSVPLEECIRRDSLRPDGERVGEKLIRQMHEQFYKDSK